MVERSLPNSAFLRQWELAVDSAPRIFSDADIILIWQVANKVWPQSLNMRLFTQPTECRKNEETVDESIIWVKGYVAPKIGPMTTEWYYIHYYTILQPTLQLKRYQSYSLTNGGAQDIDRNEPRNKGTVWHSEVPQGVTDERTIGQGKNINH